MTQPNQPATPVDPDPNGTITNAPKSPDDRRQWAKIGTLLGMAEDYRERAALMRAGAIRLAHETEDPILEILVTTTPSYVVDASPSMVAVRALAEVAGLHLHGMCEACSLPVFTDDPDTGVDLEAGVFCAGCWPEASDGTTEAPVDAAGNVIEAFEQPPERDDHPAAASTPAWNPMVGQLHQLAQLQALARTVASAWERWVDQDDQLVPPAAMLTPLADLLTQLGAKPWGEKTKSGPKAPGPVTAEDSIPIGPEGWPVEHEAEMSRARWRPVAVTMEAVVAPPIRVVPLEPPPDGIKVTAEPAPTDSSRHWIRFGVQDPLSARAFGAMVQEIVDTARGLVTGIDIRRKVIAVEVNTRLLGATDLVRETGARTLEDVETLLAKALERVAHQESVQAPMLLPRGSR